MFKESFKYYKSKKPPPDLTTVLNFHDEASLGNYRVKKLKVSPGNFFGLKPSELWKVYEVENNPGLIYIKNPFTHFGERYWIVRCLKDFTKKPNKLNIDPHSLVPDNEDWWEYSQKNKDVMKKLRWATLGYHHDWDSKIYSESNKNEVPSDLNELCGFVSKVLGFSYFNAEAVIVNFYHLDSQLSGHTDHSEENLEVPLFSFSFGSSAVFLIGGQTLEETATPILLQSGDVVIMSKESRLCYHGVPKILPSATKTWENNEKSEYSEHFSEYVVNDKFWKPFGDYVNTSRININSRQVLKPGQKTLTQIK